MHTRRHTYQVLAKKPETANITTLTLQRVDGRMPVFRAGQYITVYFPDLNSTLGKEYTISSAPYESSFHITVKAMGRYSGRLCSLKVGDTFLASGAQGHFYPHDTESVCLIAGGMGITPFRSIIKDALNSARKSKVHLLYSGRYAFDMPFSEELFRLSNHALSFTLDRFVTRDIAIPRAAKSRRMRREDILSVMQREAPQEYLVSGSLPFVCDVKDVLGSLAVPAERVLTEICS